MTDATVPAPADDVLLRVDSLVKYYPVRVGVLIKREVASVKAVDGVDLELRRGETLGLVGETGSGKSTLARCIAGLHPVTSGRITFEGSDITNLTRRRMQPFRRDIQMIFQDPYGSLNPRRRVGSIIGDPFTVHKVATGDERKHAVQELMERVGLNPEHYNRFPAEFSGGQRQRIGVARALALHPKLIICDEPVSALDVSIQAQMLNLLEDLQDDFGLTYLFIAHDLSVVRHVSDRVAVMYLGKIAEIGERDDVYATGRHPYTQALLAAAPAADPDEAASRQRIILVGDVPSPLNPPSGCRFHPRCPKAQERCSEEEPQLEVKSGDPGTHRLPATSRSRRAKISQGRPRCSASGPSPASADQGNVKDTDMSLTEVQTIGSSVEEATALSIEGRSPWQFAWRRLRSDKVAVASGIIIVLLCAVALAAPLIADATGKTYAEQFRNTGTTAQGLPVGPGSQFWFGTDNLGRDIFIRVIYGARISLLVGLSSTAIAVVAGVIVGLFAGYYGRGRSTRCSPASPTRCSRSLTCCWPSRSRPFSALTCRW